MLPRALGARKPCSEPLASKLFLRTPPPGTGLMGMPEDFGVLPTVAEPLVIVAPPAVRTVAVPVVGGFLYPKEPPAEGFTRPEGGLRCSAFSRPASERERWRPVAFTDIFTLSTAFESPLGTLKKERKQSLKMTTSHHISFVHVHI